MTALRQGGLAGGSRQAETPGSRRGASARDAGVCSPGPRRPPFPADPPEPKSV